jgi:hypothetical protein
VNKKIPILFCLLIVAFSFAQTIIPNGSVALKSGEKYDFVNLRIEGDNVSFNDVATNKNFNVSLAQIKSMQGKPLSAEDAAKAEQARKAAARQDTRFRPNYPAGIYLTKEDFVNKTPGNIEKIAPDVIDGYDTEYMSDAEKYCFFRYEASGNKVKNVFAVSYNGFLYFQLESVLKNRNKTDRAQTNDRYNQFIRVIDGGENYYYFEAELANKWAQGVGYGVGGVAGYYMAQSSDALKGVVWDFKNKEFNIFKNCKDYQAFVKSVLPEAVSTCRGQFADIYNVRRVISQIK